MSERRVVDVRELPSDAFGFRDPLQWGVLCLIIIEGMVFALLGVAWLYVKANYDAWTPQTIGEPAVRAEVIALSLLVVSGAVEIVGVMMARRKNLVGMQLATGGATLLGLAAIAARAYELPRLQFRWDTNAHGSVFWAILFLHSVHMVAGTVENGVFTALLLRGPVEKKHLMDLENNGIYWCFVAFSWIPLFALLYLERLYFPK